MEFQGAAVKINNQKLAIVAVKSWVLEDNAQALRYIELFSPIFQGNPIILMAVEDGKPRYGSLKRHQHLARMLNRLKPADIPWAKFKLQEQPH